MQSLSSDQGIFHRARTNNFTICMEIQKTSNSQSNLEKEEWNWSNQAPGLQALPESHSHQDSMVLAERQKYRSMKHRFCLFACFHLFAKFLSFTTLFLLPRILTGI